jgi:hypothetical protein
MLKKRTAMAICIMALAISAAAQTVNQIPKYQTSTTFSDSPISVSGSNVGIGTTNPTDTLTIFGGMSLMGSGTVLNIYPTDPPGVTALDVEPTFTTGDFANIMFMGATLTGGEQGGEYDLVIAGPSVTYSHPNLTISTGLAVLDRHGVSPDLNAAVWVQDQGTGVPDYAVYVEGGKTYLGGNVGIGTPAPVYKLDVAGQIRSSSGGVIFPDGSTQTTAYTPSAAALDNVLTQTGGNIGIGTTSPVYTADIAGDFHVNSTVTPNWNYATGNVLGLCDGGAACGGQYGVTSGADILQIATNTNGNGGGPRLLLAMNPSSALNSSARQAAYILAPDAASDMVFGTKGSNGVPFSFMEALHTGAVNFPNVNVGIGTATPGAKLEVSGSVKLTAGSGGSITFQDGTTQSTAYTGVTCGGDYAESVDVTGDRTKYEPGDVLVLDSDNPGKILKSAEPYSVSVSGIYSTKPGTVGRRQTTPANPDEVPMAVIGIVPAKVSAENGPIKVGDLLVTSSTPGYAMRGTDRSRMLGAIVGKAMATLDSGKGAIEVLVTLQ